MITYAYWGLVFAAVFGVIWMFGRMDQWKVAMIGGATILLIGWASYYFYFQQVFVKRWGGVMSISVPDGQLHITATWKDDNLWIENYDPKTNKCIFTEYSKGNVLEGRVTIKNCNPIIPGVPGLPNAPRPQ
ncbi:MAG: hypothetical protein ACN4GT_07385 [Gammaproteobacteria bacterium]